MTLFKRLFRERKERKPQFGWSIFAQDDRINLTRMVTEAQRKQMQQLP